MHSRRSGGERPGVLKEPEPQGAAATVGYVAARAPLIWGLPLLADEAIDGRTLKKNLAQKKRAQQETSQLEQRGPLAGAASSSRTWRRRGRRGRSDVFLSFLFMLADVLVVMQPVFQQFMLEGVQLQFLDRVLDIAVMPLGQLRAVQLLAWLVRARCCVKESAMVIVVPVTGSDTSQQFVTNRAQVQFSDKVLDKPVVMQRQRHGQTSTEACGILREGELGSDGRFLVWKSCFHEPFVSGSHSSCSCVYGGFWKNFILHAKMDSWRGSHMETWSLFL